MVGRELDVRTFAQLVTINHGGRDALETRLINNQLTSHHTVYSIDSVPQI